VACVCVSIISASMCCGLRLIAFRYSSFASFVCYISLVFVRFVGFFQVVFFIASFMYFIICWVFTNFVLQMRGSRSICVCE